MDRNLLSKLFIRTLTKAGVQEDKIVLCEALIDNVELALDIEQPESSGMVPLDRPKDKAVDWPIEPTGNESIQPPPSNAKAFQRAMADPDKLIITVDEDRRMRQQGMAVGAVAKPIDLSRVGPPAVPTKPKEDINKVQWETHDLITAIERAFPPEIEFTPSRLDKDEVRLVAVRNIKNIVNQIGAGTIRLEYVVPGLRDGEGGVVAPSDGGVPTVPVSIGLIASHTFSPYQREHDFEAALSGPTGIIEQLKGLYNPRQEKMGGDPGPDPGPLRFSAEAISMKDSFGEAMRDGWKIVADPRASVKRGLVDDNKRLKV